MADWTDEDVALLLKLRKEHRWADSKIAARMGRSRSAVIGKLYRLGVRTDANGVPFQVSRAVLEREKRANKVAMGRRKGEIARRAEAEAAPQDPAAVSIAKVVPMKIIPNPDVVYSPAARAVLELGAHQCKWPLPDGHGNTTAGVHGFCSSRREPGQPYCSEHMAARKRRDYPKAG